MRLILTKVSFPYRDAGIIDYLKKEFGDLPDGQAAAVVAIPKGASFPELEGARLTIVTSENLDPAVREIDANYRAFREETSAAERLYLAFACVGADYLDDLRRGARQPDSLDAGILAEMLRRE
jgi:hypothetical protein